MSVYGRKPIGRPRHRLWRSDYRPGAVLDANALRRDAKTRGLRLEPPPPATCWWTGADGDTRTLDLRIEAFAHPIYGWRWLFRCPKCWHFQRLLFCTKYGPKCRHCLGLRYSN